MCYCDRPMEGLLYLLTYNFKNLEIKIFNF